MALVALGVGALVWLLLDGEHSEAPKQATARTPAAAPRLDHVAGGCLAKPSACGYPDATNTGVPAGSTLTPVDADHPRDCTKGCHGLGHGWHFDGSTLRVDTRGAVLSNVSTVSIYVINAPDAVIKNTRVTCSDANCIAVQIRGDAPASNNVTVTDTAITDTVPGPSAGIYNTGATGMNLERVNVDGFGSDVQTSTYGFSVTDSYIHGVAVAGGSHGNGIQTSGGGGATIRHNTIVNEHNRTDAVMLTNDFGTPQKDDLVTGNLIAGGGFTIYGGNTGSGGACGGRCSNISITNNRVLPGALGWLTDPAPGATITGNIHDLTARQLDH